MAPDVKMEVMLVQRWCGGGQGGIWEVWEGGSPMMWRANKATAPTCMLDTPLRDEDQEGERERKRRKKENQT